MHELLHRKDSAVVAMIVAMLVVTGLILSCELFWLLGGLMCWHDWLNVETHYVDESWRKKVYERRSGRLVYVAIGALALFLGISAAMPTILPAKAGEVTASNMFFSGFFKTILSFVTMVPVIGVLCWLDGPSSSWRETWREAPLTPPAEIHDKICRKCRKTVFAIAAHKEKVQQELDSAEQARQDALAQDQRLKEDFASYKRLKGLA